MVIKNKKPCCCYYYKTARVLILILKHSTNKCIANGAYEANICKYIKQEEKRIVEQKEKLCKFNITY